MKHTPGPSDFSPEEIEANAHLIAAAPDLLEAAKLGLKVSERWIHDQLDGTEFLDTGLKELQPIRDAIAKAEGQPGTPPTPHPRNKAP